MTQSLTTHLVSGERWAESLKRATRHVFLERAGQRSLGAKDVAGFITQDRLYMHGYIRFIGILLSRASQPTTVTFAYRNNEDDANDARARRILRILTDALTNIMREIAFVEETAKANNLPFDHPPSSDILSFIPKSDDPSTLLHPNTRAYLDFMVATATTLSFEAAMVLLWAMEHVYLTAWTFAASQPRESGPIPEVAKTLDALISNWTVPEFEGFVRELGEIVDDMGIMKNAGLQRECEDIWGMVLAYEERFWGKNTAAEP